MAGTILLTGANSSLAMPAVEHLLAKFPEYTAVLTVRDDSPSDRNTNALRAIIKRYPEGKVSLRALDLADWKAVVAFSKKVAEEVTKKELPPITGIVCNAFYWNLRTSAEQTVDEMDKTLQVTFVSHAYLVLRLLGSMDREKGRVVFLGSENHQPGKSPFEKIPPSFPADLDTLKAADKPEETDKLAKGFWRYSVVKVLVITWMHALNTRLEKDPNLSHITAVAIDPGALTDSRAFQTNTPFMLSAIQRFVMRPFRPVLAFSNPTMRTTSMAGPDLIKLAASEAHPGERGYFVHLNKSPSTEETMNEANQEKLWAKTLEWAKITEDDTSLKLGA